MLTILTILVLVVVLPQMVKTRRLMGEARTEDRFSPDTRLLDTTPAPQVAERPKNIRLHAQRPGANMDRPATRSSKLAREIREYNQARAARSAAISRRVAAAQRRAFLMIVLVMAAGSLGVFAGFGALAWTWAALPVAGMALVTAWGTWAAKRGRAEDARLRAQIKEIEQRLARVPAGRKALHSARPTPSQVRWAQVAAGAAETAASAEAEAVAEAVGVAEAVAGEPGSAEGREIAAPAQALDAAQSETAQVAVESAAEETEETQPGQVRLEDGQRQTAELIDEVFALVEDEGQRQAKSQVKVDPAKAWTPVPVPPPTYTLRENAPARQVAALENFDYATARVPARPRQATPLPAGAALSAEEIAAVTPVDIESILERRRVSGE